MTPAAPRGDRAVAGGDPDRGHVPAPGSGDCRERSWVSSLGAAAMLLVLRDVPFRPLFSRTRLRRLIAVGLPLISVALLVLGLTTIDRLAIAAIGGTTLLGTYTFAVAVAGFTTSMAGWVRTVAAPEV